MKQQYAVTVYQPDNISQIEDSEIQFAVSDGMFLEMVLLNIRGNTIKFSSNQKKT